jgi:hypothetical protein
MMSQNRGQSQSSRLRQTCEAPDMLGTDPERQRMPRKISRHSLAGRAESLCAPVSNCYQGQKVIIVLA